LRPNSWSTPNRSVLGLLAVKPANAFTVIDPTNLVQNTLTEVRTLEMANNQVRQLQNETQMLLNQARHLQRLDYNVVSQLRASLANTERLLAEARGLAYEVQRLDQEFSRLYPNEYTGDVSSQRLAEEARERYAALHSKTYGEEVDALTLIPHMLEAFMAKDRVFKRTNKPALSAAPQTTDPR
jgi:P-type conjugative transfer protein TrbJ